MSRIIALDYGKKRTGIAVTDPFQIIGQALTTVDTKDLIPFLSNYFKEEEVSEAIIGYPLNLDGSPTHSTPLVEKFIIRFKRIFPHIPITEVDEAYTSKMAVQAMIDAGIKKSQRQVKGNIDKISAAIMLQDYLSSKS